MTPYAWLESIKVVPGGEATWQGGELRFWLDRIDIRIGIQRGRLARLLGRRPAPTMCELDVRLATPGRPAFPSGTTTELQAGFPVRFGQFVDDAPLLAARRGVVFEIHSVVESGAAAIVRAGLTEVQPDVTVAGDLAALDPAARRFISWWLDQTSTERWAGARNAALGYPPIPGYGLRLMPMSTGSLATTFHRDHERFFVRTYGGCLSPTETWYGPFIVGGSGFRPAPP